MHVAAFLGFSLSLESGPDSRTPVPSVDLHCNIDSLAALYIPVSLGHATNTILSMNLARDKR